MERSEIRVCEATLRRLLRQAAAESVVATAEYCMARPTGEPAKILMSYWYFRPGGDACRSPGTPPGEVERTYQMFNPAPMLLGSPSMDTSHRKSWDDIRRDATRFAKDWRLAYDEK